MPPLITTRQTIAFVMSARIGDTLIAMVVVHNLLRSGLRVTVFSKHLYELRDWFPGVTIEPALDADQARDKLQHFGAVLMAYEADRPANIHEWHPSVHIMDQWPVYRQIKPMVDIQVDICRHTFGLKHADKDNGLRIPLGVESAVEPTRVIIHPTASNVQKQWLPERFMRLANRLRDQGYAPCFVVAPYERRQWEWVEDYGHTLRTPANLNELARLVLRAGLFIGNDSGVAHLASNLGVPVVSLAMRPRIARRWQPGWSPCRTLTALPLAPGRGLKEALWKYLLPVWKVERAVYALQQELMGTSRAFGAMPEPQPGLWEQLASMSAEAGALKLSASMAATASEASKAPAAPVA